MNTRLRFSSLCLALMLCAGLLSGCAPRNATKQQASGLKLAMILPGPIADEDYNMIGFQAVREIGRTQNVQIAYAEKVPVADSERVAREYIAEGYNVIAFHGGQFTGIGTKLAPEFPDVTFILETSGQMANQPANVWNIARRFFMGAYPLGVLAAQTTKSGKVGVIAGTPMQDTIERINAIQQAVSKTNPNVKLTYVLTGDQNDTVAAHDSAQKMIGDGVDFIIDLLNGGTFGVEQAAKEASTSVLMATYYTDKGGHAPQLYTTSMLVDFSAPYKQVIGQIQGGTRSGFYEMLPGAGLKLAQVRNVPSTARTAALDTFKQIESKSLAVKVDSQKLYDK